MHKENVMSNEAVIVLALIPFKESLPQPVKDALPGLLSATRAEDGNISYNAHIPADGDNKLYFHEVWKSKAALDEHLQTPHLTGFLEAAGPFLDGEPEITLWRALD